MFIYVTYHIVCFLKLRHSFLAQYSTIFFTTTQCERTQLCTRHWFLTDRLGKTNPDYIPSRIYSQTRTILMMRFYVKMSGWVLLTVWKLISKNKVVYFSFRFIAISMQFVIRNIYYLQINWYELLLTLLIRFNKKKLMFYVNGRLDDLVSVQITL